MFIDNKTLLDYQFIINYEKVKLLQEELINIIEKNTVDIGFNSNFENSGMEIIHYAGYNHDIVKSIRRYITETTIINKSLDLFEQTGKGIFVSNGLSWDECKTFGHNILKIYQALPQEYKEQLLSCVSENFNISNDNEMMLCLSKFTYVNDVNGNITKMLANISTRYPGENFSKYSKEEIKFISKISSKLFYLYQAHMPNQFKELYSYEDNISKDIIDNTYKNFRCK